MRFDDAPVKKFTLNLKGGKKHGLLVNSRNLCAQKQTAKLEKAVEDAEARLAALEEELAAPEAWASQYESAKNTARHTAAKRAVDDAYAALEEHLEKTEA